ncbi:MAG TPA: hypothetical protein VF459_07800, partial [Caulobacteraceae bacterium]
MAVTDQGPRPSWRASALAQGARAYGVSLALIVAAAAADGVLMRLAPSISPFLMFTPAVLAAAWFGGA